MSPQSRAHDYIRKLSTKKVELLNGNAFAPGFGPVGIQRKNRLACEILYSRPVALELENHYAVFSGLKTGQQLTLTYPLRVMEMTETPGSLDGTRYTERWRGNTIVDIEPKGKWIPLYVRPEMDTDVVP